MKLVSVRLKLERSPYRHLLEEPDFRAWLENLERGSVTTASGYLRRIGHICATFNVVETLAAF